MVGTSTTDFTVLPADYFRHILTGTKIQCKWVRAQPEIKWVEVIIVVSQHNFFLISNHNFRMQLFFKLLLEHVHGVVVMAI